MVGERLALMEISARCRVRPVWWRLPRTPNHPGNLCGHARDYPLRDRAAFSKAEKRASSTDAMSRAQCFAG